LARASNESGVDDDGNFWRFGEARNEDRRAKASTQNDLSGLQDYGDGGDVRLSVCLSAKLYKAKKASKI